MNLLLNIAICMLMPSSNLCGGIFRPVSAAILFIDTIAPASSRFVGVVVSTEAIGRAGVYYFMSNNFCGGLMPNSKRLAALRTETDCAVKSLMLHFSPIDKHRRYISKLDPAKIKFHLSWIVRNLKQIDALQGGVI